MAFARPVEVHLDSVDPWSSEWAQPRVACEPATKWDEFRVLKQETTHTR